jgi:hypothetical protein
MYSNVMINTFDKLIEKYCFFSLLMITSITVKKKLIFKGMACRIFFIIHFSPPTH